MPYVRTVQVSGWGAAFMALAFLLALAAIVALFVSGVVWVSQHLVWYVRAAAIIAVVLSVVAFLPMSLFARTRRVAAVGLLGAAFLLGLATWMFGLLATYHAWGGLGVVIGLVLGIVGIVPLGVLAALFGAQWLMLGQLILGIALTFAARWLATNVSLRVMHEAADRRDRIIEGEIVSRP